MYLQAGVVGGYLQNTLISYLPPEEQAKHHRPPTVPRTAQQQLQLEQDAEKRRHPNRQIDATSAVIGQLEDSLKRRQSGSGVTRDV